MAKRYLLYTLSDCDFCTDAKELLTRNNISFYDFVLDEDPEFLSEVKEFYNYQFVPAIVENDEETGETKFIGGFEDLKGVV